MSDRTFRFWFIMGVFFMGAGYAKMHEEDVNTAVLIVVTVSMLLFAHGLLDYWVNRKDYR